MAYKLVVSREAHLDIDEIVGYIAGDLKNPLAASGFLDDVEKSYRVLIQNPHLFALCADERLQRRGYRKAVIKNYLVLYRVDEKKRTVYVVRMVHGSRNYPELL